MNGVVQEIATPLFLQALDFTTDFLISFTTHVIILPQFQKKIQEISNLLVLQICLGEMLI